MAQQSMAPAPPQRSGVGRIGWWVLVVVSFALLASLILNLWLQRHPRDLEWAVLAGGFW